jgi:two-component system phosphate regulon sensor histidine kinase PhoR
MRATRVEVPFDALAELSADGFVLVDGDGTVEQWSDAAALITGISAAGAIGKRVTAIFANGHELFAVTGARPRQLRFTWSDEPDRAIRAAALQLNNGWLLSFGPQRRYRSIEQLKSEIIAAVSHELKTPIATIKAYAMTLRGNHTAIDTERDEYLSTIEEQADRLTFAVEDLLLAARVDVEYLLERRTCVPLEVVLDDAIARLAPWKAERRVQRSIKGVTICGDPGLLRDALIHMIENALKFSSPSSKVIVEAASDDARTTVRIRDFGVGLDDEHLPYIFDRFYRVENNLTASTGGSGLGLYISLAIVRAHGGAIAVQSRLGAGSTFTITLPVRT